MENAIIIHMNEDTLKKLSRIQSLLKDKERIEKELEKLLSPEKVIALPYSFSLKDEVLEVIKNTGTTGVSSQGILNIMQQKYPDYKIQRDQVASTLAYLKNTKKMIEIIDRGIYRTKTGDNKNLENQQEVS